MKKVVSLIVGGCLILMASSSFAWPGPGSTAPKFTLVDTAGVKHSLSDFKGKTVFINWWDSG